MSRKVNGNAPNYELTPQQIDAIGLLLSGKSAKATAAAVGVREETLSRWRHTQPHFAAALNVARAELVSDTLDALRALRRRAVDVVAEALNDDATDADARRKVALAVLRLDVPVADGPLTPEQTELAWHDARDVDLLAMMRVGDYAKPGTVVLPYTEAAAAAAV